MYQLDEAWQMMSGEKSGDGKRLIICEEMGSDMVGLADMLQDTVACYTFCLLTSGRLTLTYDRCIYNLMAGDFHIHSPEVPYEMVEATDDLHVYLFVVDLSLVLSPEIMQGVTDYVGMRVAVPRLSLPPEAASRIGDIMRLAMHYYRSDKPFRDETLRSLLRLLLLELGSLATAPTEVSRHSARVESLFLGFLRLLSQHWLDHRDLKFYADSLCVSTTYLSRVVRRVAGRTVIDYINDLLLIEASHLLQHTTLTVAQIADRLHFAETSSFVRFFQRMRGMSPTAYRERKDA